ncbi:Uba3-binding protein but2 [Schizosaccharomyces japonicus yFS275]|uniref:Uba3-binding protein but2 n=1 Tax=Schizosaccharomyces japonicus (strain yFS275 / FY16936) TaxID=402676 RepID=B6JZD0_SCHJY|nr:Uba3-binding protein but2 [Schizosaccharomyces japonicus yFS275]EEB06898.1 Uba3-binding protein but2 [Schizosaccharomyces japonicus yFS275]
MKFSSLLTSGLLGLLGTAQASPLWRRVNSTTSSTTSSSSTTNVTGFNDGTPFGVLTIRSGNPNVHLHGFYVSDDGDVYLSPYNNSAIGTFEIADGSLTFDGKTAFLGKKGELLFGYNVTSPAETFTANTPTSLGYYLLLNGSSPYACPVYNGTAFQVYYGKQLYEDLVNGTNTTLPTQNPECVGFEAIGLKAEAPVSSTKSEFASSTASSTVVTIVTASPATSYVYVEPTTITSTAAGYTTTVTLKPTTITSTVSGHLTTVTVHPSTYEETVSASTVTVHTGGYTSVVTVTETATVTSVLEVVPVSSGAASSTVSSALPACTYDPLVTNVGRLFPNDIRNFNSSTPNDNTTTQYSAVVYSNGTEFVSSILSFDVPAHTSDDCQVNLHFDLNGFPFGVSGPNGTGSFDIYNLTGSPNDTTTYNSVPQRIARIGSFNCTDGGCDYTADVVCPKSFTRVSYELAGASNGSALTFFEQASPIEGMTLLISV